MSSFKPMLSAKLDGTPVFPYLASPKLDSVRALVRNGQLVSRSLKPIANKYIREILSDPILDGLDGELLIGDPSNKEAFKESIPIIMSKDKVDDRFILHVFDYFTFPDRPFHERLYMAEMKLQNLARFRPDLSEFLRMVPHTVVTSQSDLDRYEQDVLAQGYEGVMLRSMDGPYKFGRSTVKENYLLKVKRYSDDEATVIGFVELMHNDNEATIDHLGHTKRSTHKDNKRPAGTLGALQVRNKAGVEFEIGTGFTEGYRQVIWDNQGHFIGKVLTYKHFEHGKILKPRHPVFLRWRPDHNI